MERPLEDVRPLGPFAQSEEFANELLGGDEEISRGDSFVFIGRGKDELVVDDMEFAVEEMMQQAQNFVEFNKVETLTEFGGEESTIVILMDAIDVRDREVTVNQIENLIEQEVKGIEGGSAVINMTLSKI